MAGRISSIAVIPAYNEEEGIRDLVLQVQRHVDCVIVVDDGSEDSTAACLQDIDVTLLRNTGNMGKGASLQRGFMAALEYEAHAVITLDADGQHRPEDIPLLVNMARSFPNRLIIGARTRNREAAPLIRRFANRFADFWISWAAGYRIRDSQSGFRLYPVSLLRTIQLLPGRKNSFVFESDILITAARMGWYSESVSIDTIHRRRGRSYYRPVVDTWNIVRMVAVHLFRRGMYPRGLLCSMGMLPDPRKPVGEKAAQ